MATHKPPSCAAGGPVPSSHHTLEPADDAPRCSDCGNIVLSVVSIQSGRCAVCRSEQRATMTTIELERLAEELQQHAARLRNISAFGSAGDFEAEARLVRAIVTARLEDISNA